ncbi:hypothetical protein F1188_10940 [Roseospira marina]|uniref:Uncharacterized protein n=1 Tax=Roseospira marina TaxID=140057 RepID=A0A5M6IBB5_9PROT|nr:hypothetical protein [Roseospira marina]KAA5605412.1 hypothetical protein F1188_10940 [Roseospira marina]MBB4314597.1 hypothetical protein [Roseospira marina]MBB5088798.1 hypothetical protein [Roseospira marina]
MPLSAVALCSRALIAIGAGPLTSLDDGTAEAQVAGALYPGVRDALLSAHPWTFATAQTALARLSEVPAADFAHAYRLPGNHLRTLSAGAGGSGRGLVYRQAEARLWTDAPAVTLTYIFRPDESAFPAPFVEALAARLAAAFCLPLTESTSRAQLLHQLAEDAVRAARLIDSQQDTPPALAHFPLVEVRG